MSSVNVTLPGVHRAMTLEELFEEAQARYPLGTVYTSFGRDCTVKGRLAMIGTGDNLMFSDGWGGSVYSFGYWAPSYGIDEDFY